MTQQEHAIMTAQNLAVIMRGFCLRDFPEHTHIHMDWDGVWATVSIENDGQYIYAGHTADAVEWSNDTEIFNGYKKLNDYYTKEASKNVEAVESKVANDQAG